MIAPSESRLITGMTSCSGALDMITPAAWTPHCRLRPSIPIAVSTTVFTSGSASYNVRNSPPSPYRSCSLSKSSLRGTSLPITAGGMALVIRSPIAKG